MAKYYLLRFAAWLAPRVPYGVATRLAGALAWLWYVSNGAARRRARANLAHVPGLAEDPRRLDEATRGVFLHTALNYVDFLRGPYLTDDQLLSRWVIAGQDVLDAAVAEGKGVVVLTGHFGNWEYGVSRLGAIGHQIVTPMQHLQPEALYQLFTRIREHHNLRLYPADARESARRMIEALREGAMVAIVADRHVVGGSIAVPFFGELAKLPTAAMALALRSGAPTLAIFCWRGPGGYSHGTIVPLKVHGEVQGVPAGARGASTRTESAEGAASAEDASPPSSATAVARAPGGNPARARVARGDKEEIAAAMRHFVAALEAVIEAHPEQWGSALSPVWDTPDEEAP